MSQFLFCLHHITDENLPGFSMESYSKFKYGSHSVAEQFANALFDTFILDPTNDALFDHQKIIIYSSPYDFLPTSSYYMTKCFFEKLKAYTSLNKYNCKVEFGKINRNQTYAEDYGALSAEERFNLIKNDTYELPERPSENAVLLFMDDISITGTHQKVIELLLNREGIKNDVGYLYFAKLMNKDVNPNYENVLNYAFVNDLPSLMNVLYSKDFMLTTRFVKHLLSLSTSDFSQLLGFLDNEIEGLLLKEIYLGALRNRYDKMEAYELNMSELSLRFKTQDSAAIHKWQYIT
jgi:hypothetical protein